MMVVKMINVDANAVMPDGLQRFLCLSCSLSCTFSCFQRTCIVYIFGFFFNFAAVEFACMDLLLAVSYLCSILPVPLSYVKAKL